MGAIFVIKIDRMSKNASLRNAIKWLRSEVKHASLIPWGISEELKSTPSTHTPLFHTQNEIYANISLDFLAGTQEALKPHFCRLILDRPTTFELLPLQVDPELHGDLHQYFDPGQEVCEHGEGAARDHGVDVLQAAVVVVGVDAVLDHVQVERDRVWELQCGGAGKERQKRGDRSRRT